VFQSDFARALKIADHVILPPVFRSALPEDQRLSGEQVIADLKREGVDARYLPSVDEIVRVVARESRSGDLVLVMSNGGFDNIHQKLLAALTARASR
jgi:UDP-N-acetylmuramate: L-alanyl-gamma-D-glutamyl-meso-diaminopimelate ligase